MYRATMMGLSSHVLVLISLWAPGLFRNKIHPKKFMSSSAFVARSRPIFQLLFAACGMNVLSSSILNDCCLLN